uniref:Putative secreted protein n=1 Tax=Ixodes ricinus TaxID=34613 RepID=A0A0K8RB17_IXORI
MNMPRIFVSGLLVLWIIETCSSTLLLLSTTTTLLLLPILSRLLSQPGAVAGLSQCSRVWFSLPVLSLENKPDRTPCKWLGVFDGTCRRGRCVTSSGAGSEGSFGSAENSETTKRKQQCRRGADSSRRII